MTLYRNKINHKYYKVSRDRVYLSSDKAVWYPSVFTVRNLEEDTDTFEVVEHPPITLENK